LIHGSILSPTSTAEQGQLHFETATAGALTEKMIIGTTNLVINEIGAIFNVRIEGDTDANLFYTDATNSRVGVGTVSPAEKLDVVGNIKLSGNVMPASGFGIDFAATSGTGTSELLADYEEGTWTPLMSANGGGSDNWTSTTATGRYTKIGRLVSVQCTYTYTAKQSTTGDYAWMTGLPFTPGITSGYFYVGVNSGGGADTATYSGVFFTGVQVGFVKDQNQSGAGYMTGADFPAATKTITFQASYIV